MQAQKTEQENDLLELPNFTD